MKQLKLFNNCDCGQTITKTAKRCRYCNGTDNKHKIKMPIIIKKKLILVEAKKIEFVGRDMEKVEKVKYTFLTPDGQLTEAFDDNGGYTKDIQEVSAWDDKKAKEYPFKATLFNGRTEYKLMPKK